MADTTMHDVEDFVRSRLWEPKGGLSPDTRLREDIGVGGAEAAEFMQEYSDRYKVDMSDFNFDKYFEGEASAILIPFALVGYVYNKIRGRRIESGLDSIRVSDLVKSAEARRWIEPDVGMHK